MSLIVDRMFKLLASIAVSQNVLLLRLKQQKITTNINRFFMSSANVGEMRNE